MAKKEIIKYVIENTPKWLIPLVVLSFLFVVLSFVFFCLERVYISKVPFKINGKEFGTPFKTEESKQNIKETATLKQNYKDMTKIINLMSKDLREMQIKISEPKVKAQENEAEKINIEEISTLNQDNKQLAKEINKIYGKLHIAQMQIKEARNKIQESENNKINIEEIALIKKIAKKQLKK